MTSKLGNNPKPLEMSIHPVMRGTGSDRQLQPMLPRIIDQFPHTGQRRLSIDRGKALLPDACFQPIEIQFLAGQRREMGAGSKLEAAVPPTICPHVWTVQILPVITIDFLPREQFGGFSIEDQSIEVEDERFDHGVYVDNGAPAGLCGSTVMD